MSKKLAVILGAGASFDLVPAALEAEIKNREYRPPLTENLFRGAPWVIPILANYPRAQTAIALLRMHLQDKSQTLEGFLKELREIKEESENQQFRQIPLCLQHIFREISDLYCYHPVNYSILVSKTHRSSISDVAYVTLNYDLFIEEALQKEREMVFDDISKYIPSGEKWIYIKLHGSINWGRSINKITNPGDTVAAFLENIRVLDLDRDIEPDIVVDNSYKSRPGTNVGYRFYPALSVPVEGEYKLNCPQEHVSRLKDFLKECKNFLIIGVSGKDQDLLDILKETVTGDPKSIVLVGGNNVGDAHSNFLKGVPKFQNAGWQIYENGFSDFIIKGQLDSFLDSLN